MATSYIPILRGMRGEFSALAHLTPDSKARMLPLVALPRLRFDPAEQESETPPEQHFGPPLANLLKVWGSTNEILLDSGRTPISCRAADGRSYLDWVFERCRDIGIIATPVTGFDRDDESNEVIAGIHRVDRRGAAVRLTREDIEVAPQDLDLNLKSLLTAAGLHRSDVVLILDVGEVSSKMGKTLLQTTRKVLAGLPGIQDYKTVVLAGSAMPGSLKIVPPGSPQEIARHELDLWKHVLDTRPRRLPLFGDYGVVGPNWVEPSGPVRTSPTIRYTAENYWLVLRGRPFHKHPLKYGQYHGLARILATTKEFRGPKYSWGDQYVEDCARPGSAHTGNLETWISAGTNHHLTFTGKQAETLLSAA